MDTLTHLYLQLVNLMPATTGQARHEKCAQVPSSDALPVSSSAVDVKQKACTALLTCPVQELRGTSCDLVFYIIPAVAKAQAHS
jgi:hypothetical protein